MISARALATLSLPLLLAGCPSEKSSAPTSTATAPLATPPPSTTTSTSPPTVTAPAASASGAPHASTSASAMAIPPIAPIHVPPSIGDAKRPFILFLHGLGASGKVLSDAIGLPAFSAEKRFVWAAPDGAMSSKGQRFWNASKACCDFDNVPYPHVDELTRIIDAARVHPSVDIKRIFVVGISNGAFMAQRLACEVDGLAGVISIAGAGPAEGETCNPKGPVSVLEIHGDADEVIRYNGGQALGHADLPRHPSAMETIAGWAQREHCQPKGAQAGTIDIDDKLEGAETSVLRFAGCDRPVELWTVKGATHYIGTSRRMQDAVLAFLESHPKP